jgi:hypothetical protein
MFRKVWLLLIVLLSTFNVWSQVQVGVRAGATVGSQRVRMHGSGKWMPIKTDLKAGYQAGIFATAFLDRKSKWSLAAEVNYVQIGARYPSPERLADLDPEITNKPFAIRLNYLELPLIVRYHFKRFYLGGGGAISLLVSSDAGRKDFWGQPVQLDYRSTDFSLTGLAGMKLNSNWEFYLRYCHGVSDVDNHAKMLVQNIYVQAAVLYHIWPFAKRR